MSFSDIWNASQEDSTNGYCQILLMFEQYDASFILGKSRARRDNYYILGMMGTCVSCIRCHLCYHCVLYNIKLT